MLKGSCQCEGVQFVVDAIEPTGVNCYCTICRKIAGAPFAAVVMAKRGSFRIERGQELLAKHNATPGFDRWHCSRCFSPVYGDVAASSEMPLFFPATAFDAAEIAHLRFDHMFVRSLVPWHTIADDRPRHATFPE
jgi:hypothetical protein